MVRVGGPNPQQIRALTSGDVVDVSDKPTREVGIVYQPDSLNPWKLCVLPFGIYDGEPIELRMSQDCEVLVEADVTDRVTRLLGIANVEQPDPSKLRVEIARVVTPKIINLTATGIIHTPASGKKIRLRGFTWSSNADIVTALRFGAGGDLLFAIQAKGVIGFNLINCLLEGAVNESLYGYLSGTGTMKGTVLIEEV